MYNPNDDQDWQEFKKKKLAECANIPRFDSPLTAVLEYPDGQKDSFDIMPSDIEKVRQQGVAALEILEVFNTMWNNMGGDQPSLPMHPRRKTKA